MVSWLVMMKIACSSTLVSLLVGVVALCCAPPQFSSVLATDREACPICLDNFAEGDLLPVCVQNNVKHRLDATCLWTYLRKHFSEQHANYEDSLPRCALCRKPLGGLDVHAVLEPLRTYMIKEVLRNSLQIPKNTPSNQVVHTMQHQFIDHLFDMRMFTDVIVNFHWPNDNQLLKRQFLGDFQSQLLELYAERWRTPTWQKALKKSLNSEFLQNSLYAWENEVFQTWTTQTMASFCAIWFQHMLHPHLKHAMDNLEANWQRNYNPYLANETIDQYYNQLGYLKLLLSMFEFACSRDSLLNNPIEPMEGLSGLDDITLRMSKFADYLFMAELRSIHHMNMQVLETQKKLLVDSPQQFQEVGNLAKFCSDLRSNFGRDFQETMRYNENLLLLPHHKMCVRQQTLQAYQFIVQHLLPLLNARMMGQDASILVYITLWLPLIAFMEEMQVFIQGFEDYSTQMLLARLTYLLNSWHTLKEPFSFLQNIQRGAPTTAHMFAAWLHDLSQMYWKHSVFNLRRYLGVNWSDGTTTSSSSSSSSAAKRIAQEFNQAVATFLPQQLGDSSEQSSNPEEEIHFFQVIYPVYTMLAKELRTDFEEQPVAFLVDHAQEFIIIFVRIESNIERLIQTSTTQRLLQRMSQVHRRFVAYVFDAFTASSVSPKSELQLDKARRKQRRRIKAFYKKFNECKNKPNWKTWLEENVAKVEDYVNLNTNDQSHSRKRLQKDLTKPGFTKTLKKP